MIVRVARLIIPGIAVFALATPTAALAAGGNGVAAPTASVTTGGAGLAAPATPPSTAAHPIVFGVKAKIIHGVAYAPSLAPIQVQRAIWAGDKIRNKPYRVGGGHGVWNDTAYDCSGSASYVLHAAGLLSVPEDSSALESYGAPGPGQYVTIYANAGHAWMTIDGRRFDTVALSETGSRWTDAPGDPSGFIVRHPVGF